MAFDPNAAFKLSSTSTKPYHHRRIPCLPVCVVVGLVCILVFILVSIRSAPSQLRFGIVIDGGSSGSRIHVYGWRIGEGIVPEIDFAASGEMKVNPGLSAYAQEPERAGESLAGLLEFGKGHVPRDLWGETEVRLMATAGLRMVESETRERILESCRRVLRASGFRFRDDWATVIPGTDEGSYAWVAANYALGTLGGDPQETTGIIELGGASAQVTFVSSEPLPPEYARPLNFGERRYNLYSHSFLHFGQNAAQDSLQELLASEGLKSEHVHQGIYDPCTPRSYSHGLESGKLSAGVPSLQAEGNDVAHVMGNYSACRSLSLMLLQKEKDKCSFDECLVGSTFVPKLQGRFLATENFFYTSKFFGLGSLSSLSDLISSGKKFCEEDKLRLKRKYSTLSEEDFSRYCFSSAYIVAFLHDGLGIALDDDRISFVNQVDNVPLDWALGAFIMQGTSSPTAPYSWIPAINRDGMLVLLFLLIIAALMVFTMVAVSKCRNPQLKTIYDLEKGRYIVTRIHR
ncbi:probable apyrase 6 isoform X2 [Dioscorea cayenensis subsp. rotundata]|uniref:Probable apyrase 6 isoform X2 n=1 Tax=Dioscorea cayennensis subsp. rotundata TaxID=55577 RepID=A0AB40BAU4_DIOCR|nr:probable apyrase 6 isoform X2 [Dioscorea cayenensis subsp. rotundata]